MPRKPGSSTEAPSRLGDRLEEALRYGLAGEIEDAEKGDVAAALGLFATAIIVLRPEWRGLADYFERALDRIREGEAPAKAFHLTRRRGQRSDAPSLAQVRRDQRLAQVVLELEAVRRESDSFFAGKVGEEWIGQFLATRLKSDPPEVREAVRRDLLAQHKQRQRILAARRLADSYGTDHGSTAAKERAADAIGKSARTVERRLSKRERPPKK